VSVVQNVLHISVMRFNFVVETAVYFLVLSCYATMLQCQWTEWSIQKWARSLSSWHAKILLLFYHRTSFSYL